MAVGSLAEWVTAGTTIVAVLAGFTSFLLTVRQRARDQARRVVVSATRFVDDNGWEALVEVVNTSDQPIFELGVWVTPRGGDFPLRFDTLSWEGRPDGSSNTPAARRLAPGATASLQSTIDRLRPDVVVRFVDAHQRWWRYSVGRRRLRFSGRPPEAIADREWDELP